MIPESVVLSTHVINDKPPTPSARMNRNSFWRCCGRSKVDDDEIVPLVAVDAANGIENTDRSSSKCCTRSCVKTVAGVSASVLVGALYWTIAKAGGENLERLFHWSGNPAEISIDTVSGVASVTYSAFFYKTLGALSLLPRRKVEGVLEFLAPFAAAPFFAAGIEGALAVGLTQEIAISVGVLLFLSRIINCGDGAVKFPDRFSEIRANWNQARERKDYKEISRIIATGLISFGYSVCTTDAIFNSVEIIGRLFGAPQESLPLDIVAYVCSALGAIGTLPMCMYWAHRGIRQLTWGGELDSHGVTPDPTDRYTAAALPGAACVTMGILGSATGTNPSVFGRLGVAAEVVRVASSVAFSIAAATPGLSSLFRGIFKKASAGEVAASAANDTVASMAPH